MYQNETHEYTLKYVVWLKNKRETTNVLKVPRHVIPSPYMKPYDANEINKFYIMFMLCKYIKLQKWESFITIVGDW